MARVYADRVQETSTTEGTGTYDLDGAVTGYQSFVSGIGDTNTVFYCATDGVDWEVGEGTVTDAAPDTLARTTVLASSNADAAVNWAAGTRTIFATNPADQMMGIDDQASQNVLTIDTTERVLIGLTVPDAVGAEAGSLTVSTGDSGVTSFNANHDDLIIEGDTSVGITLASANTTTANGYMFADPQDDNVAGVRYNHNTDALIFICNGAERARIISTGELTTNGLTSAPTGATNEGVFLSDTGKSHFASTSVAPIQTHRSESGTGSVTQVTFMRNTTQSPGAISASTTDTTYATSSDAALKRDIRSLAAGEGRALVRQMVARRFDWLVTAEEGFGFIGQELEAAFPEAVLPPDEADERPYYMVDYGRLTPALAAGLNDALDEIDDLLRRIKRLEAP